MFTGFCSKSTNDNMILTMPGTYSFIGNGEEIEISVSMMGHRIPTVMIFYIGAYYPTLAEDLRNKFIEFYSIIPDGNILHKILKRHYLNDNI
jgi:hypothetical protein